MKGIKGHIEDILKAIELICLYGVGYNTKRSTEVKSSFGQFIEEIESSSTLTIEYVKV